MKTMCMTRYSIQCTFEHVIFKNGMDFWVSNQKLPFSFSDKIATAVVPLMI